MIKDFVAFITELIRGLRLPFRWLVVISIMALISLGVITYERTTGHFYLIKLEKRIALLKELQLVNSAGIKDNPKLIKTYDSLVDELAAFNAEQAKLPNLPNISFDDLSVIGKALSGALFWLVVLIIGISSEFKKAQKVTGSIIAVGILVFILAILFAWLGTIIPSIYSPWINVALYPFILFGLTYLLFVKRKKTTVG